jgi:hypothetical protein
VFAADTEAAVAAAARAMVIFCGEIHLNSSALRSKLAVNQKDGAVKGEAEVVRLHLAHGEAQIFPDAATAHHGDADCGIHVVLAQMLFDGIKGRVCHSQHSFFSSLYQFASPANIL